MTLTELMTTMNQLGIKLKAANDGSLTAVAPPEVLTPELKSAMMTHRYAIADALGAPAFYAPAPDFPRGPSSSEAAVPTVPSVPVAVCAAQPHTEDLVVLTPDRKIRKKATGEITMNSVVGLKVALPKAIYANMAKYLSLSQPVAEQPLGTVFETCHFRLPGSSSLVVELEVGNGKPHPRLLVSIRDEQTGKVLPSAPTATDLDTPICFTCRQQEYWLLLRSHYAN